MPTIGPSHPCFVIADVGINHGGKLHAALALVDAARRAGADGVKFRVFKAERVSLTPPADLRGLELSPDAFARIRDHCVDQRIEFVAGVWDEQSLAELRQLGPRLLKLGSGEVTNRPLIEACARSGLATLLSTGASTMPEVSRAVGWFHTAFRGGLPPATHGVELEGGGRLALLHALSLFDPVPEDANLRAIQTLAARTHLPVGYSERSRDVQRAALAVAAGACVLQKPLTLNRDAECLDHRVSLDPLEFRALVESVRAVESAMGDGRKRPMQGESAAREQLRRWLAAARNLPSGHRLEPDDLVPVRPGPPQGGIGPYDRLWAVGKKLLKDVSAGECIRQEWLEGVDPPEPSWFGTTPPRERPNSM